jgi:LPXTG-motif cell wall-anchored protein
MKKLRLALAVAVVAFFAVLTPSPAQAYPGVTVIVSEATVVGGDDIIISAEVDPDVNCQWTLTFLGETRTGSGFEITETFETPEVDDEETRDAVAICTYNDDELDSMGGGGAGSLGTSIVTATQTAGDVGTQTLLPEDDDDDGDDDGDSDSDDDGDDDGDDGNGGGGDNGGLLPNTGGERLAWLIIGGMLVLVGGGVVVASRRRDA